MGKFLDVKKFVDIKKVGENVLKVHNDGKEKIQSFEVWDDSIPDIDRGYGRTQTEALVSYQQNFEEYLRFVNDQYRKLVQNNNPVKVDWMGREIK